MNAVLKTLMVCGAMSSAAVSANAADVLSSANITTSGSVAMATDYRFRGISQTSNNPAIQGAITLTHQSGVYLGLWGSNITSVGKSNSAEMDATIGYTTALPLSATLAPTLDVGYIRYGYFGTGDSAPGNNQPDYNEVFGKLTFADSIVKGDSLAGSVTYSNEYFNHSDQFWNVNASYTAPIADTGFGLVGSVGYNKFKDKAMMAQAVGGDGSDDNYIDYKAGVNFGVQGLVAELSAIGTNVSTTGFSNGDEKPYTTAAVFSLSKSF